jgi:hypothetical protein
MKKIFTFSLLVILSLLHQQVNGQTLYDSYADGDFTTSPVWAGSTTRWTIVANSDAAAGATGSNTLRLNATTVAGTDYLSSQVSSWGASQEWGFWLGRRAQAYTGANQAYIWLYANEADLTSATVDGYRLAIGDDTGGDEIRLEYIVNGAVSATVITSSGSVTNAITDVGFLIRITRSTSGAWQLFTSTLPTVSGNGAIASDIPNATNAAVSQGTATHNTIVPASNGYIGIAALHSTGASAIVGVEFDQVYLTTASSSTPTKLAITAINPASPTAGMSFSVTVQAQDGSNVAQNVSVNTDVSLSVNTGTGALGGTITGTIAANTSSVVITGVTYSVSENGVVLTATRTSGDALTPGNSATFNVLSPASQLAFVGVPGSGTATTNLSSFTVEARRPDNTVDNTYTGTITITKASGPGTLSGTTTKAAVAGVATFNDLQFDQAGTYTVSASSGSLTGVTSGSIVVAPAPVQVQAGNIVINQFNPAYNGASDEYVELVNLTGNTFDLSTLKIVYNSSTGSAGGAGGTLSGTLAPHAYWLLSPNATVTVGKTSALSRDGNITAGFAATAGQLALERVSDNVIIDGLAYGAVSVNNLGEGSAVAAPSSNSGYKRSPDGNDNNTNSLDFVSVAVSDISLKNSTSRLANLSASIIAGTYTNLIVTGNSSIGGAVFISDLVDVQGGTLTANSNLTLLSTAGKTARVGSISSGAVAGNVTVQRFIGAPSAKRAWRLLTAPFSSANTIQASWQNGQVYTPGIGTFITGSGTGLDAGNASMKTYNTASQALVDVTNTTVDIASQPGYFIFIRGDRNTNNLTPPATNTTTLSATGALRNGDQAFTTSGTNDAFTLLGNPYASQVDFDLFRQQNSTANIKPNYYYWDANAGGASSVGAYGVASWNGSSYDYTGAVTAVQTIIIPSGSAFFVQTLTDQTGTTPGVTFKETQKTSATVTQQLRVGTQTEKLDIKLQAQDASLVMNSVDGVLARFNNTYSTQVGNEDAGKLMNVGENLSIMRNGSLLVIEGRPLVDINDTLFLQLANMKVGTNYQFVISASNFNAPSLEAYLVDRLTGTSSALDLSSSTTVAFTVTSATASTGDRFMVVFRQSGVLPVNYASVKAYQQNNGIQVDWKVATESNIRNYEVEKSVDGRSFTKAGTVAAKANNNTAASYTWFDATPVSGVNYYRIKAVDNSGAGKISQVVSVKIGGGKSEISMYPNPVTSNSISLQFSNKERGTYVVQLFNNLGQQVYSKSIVHQGGSSSQTLSFGSAVSKGVYQLQVSSGSETSLSQQIIIR